MTSRSPNYQTMASQQLRQEHYDILVVGKSGNGKSAVCNTLLGQQKFPVGRGMSATTTTADCGDRVYNNMTIRVIDTPDITNCGLNHSQKFTEVEKWKHFISSGAPSMVLVAVRCDVRYTNEEYAILQEIRGMWGPQCRRDFDTKLVVAFTFGDLQDYDIREDVENPPPELRQILNMAKKRYLKFNSKDVEGRERQAGECFHKMQTIKEEEEGCFERLVRNCQIL